MIDMTVVAVKTETTVVTVTAVTVTWTRCNVRCLTFNLQVRILEKLDAIPNHTVKPKFNKLLSYLCNYETKNSSLGKAQCNYETR